MFVTNPWLAGPAPEASLPRDQLEDRILNLLSSQPVAVIATVNADGSPVATPVRYFHLGFEIMYSSWNTSVKSRNLRRDHRVSAGIVAPLVGQASSRGGSSLVPLGRSSVTTRTPTGIGKHFGGNRIMWNAGVLWTNRRTTP